MSPKCYRQLFQLLWFLWIPCLTKGGIMVFTTFATPTPGPWNTDLVYCAVQTMDGKYSGFRIPDSGGSCEPVSNDDWYNLGEQAGYQYVIKEKYGVRATLPDNLAPNPNDNYIKVPGVYAAGSSVEIIYTKSATVGYYVDFVDQPWDYLIATFRVTEPAVNVKMNSLDYGSATWGAEDFCSGFPFEPFREYKLKFVFTGTDIEVYVGDSLYHVYPHRYPFVRLRWVRLYMISATSGIHVSDVRIVIAR